MNKDETQILLGSAKHKLGINEDNFINIELFSSKRDLGTTDDSFAVDEYLQYYSEKDESQDYRLAFTITPYCTNVLFNMISEPVYEEGGSGCVLITDTPKQISNDYTSYKGVSSLDLEEVTKDTGYSLLEAGGLKYHCGYDIFDNHYFRKLGFVVVNKLSDYLDPAYKRKFNTIGDYVRDNEGEIISGCTLVTDGNYLVGKRGVAIYKSATLLDYLESVDTNLSEENGWFGFVNKSIIPVKNFPADNKWFIINKAMNDYEAGDFVDMYPDRTLYSFVPKYNEYRKRTEKNWDYCITYPSSSSRENYLIEDNGINGILCKKLTEVSSIDSYPTYTLFKTAINHNLVEGDYITITFSSAAIGVVKTNQIRVASVGVDDGDSEHYFSVRTTSILNYLFNFQNRPIAFSQIRVRKCEDGAECVYYARIFSKLKPENRDNFNSQLNKLGFAQNAYSDSVAQIVFTEDIDTYGLVDNLNRPISELYLTIVKRNKGYNEWYSNGGSGSEDVEFSHCFGKITSGFDLPEDNEFMEYNVHRIHNITGGTNGIVEAPSSLEADLTIDEDEFYGDIVEFSPVLFRETVLTPVYHRFNTAQREWQGEGFSDFKYHEVTSDIYEYSHGGETISVATNSITSYLNRNGDSATLSRINLLPEGYYYKPHYLVKVRDFSEEVNEGYHIELTYTAETQTSGERAILNLEKNYNFQPGYTKVYVYKKINGKYYDCITEGYCVDTSEDFKTVEIEFVDSVDISGDCKIFKHNPAMPAYAYDFKDGSGKYVWRDVMSFMDIPAGNELYDSQFTNGAHYHHKNISFYLKRQDPDGRYGIGNEPNRLSSFIVEDEHKEVENLEYIKETDSVKC